MSTVNWGRHTAPSAARARAGLFLIASALVLSGCASAPAPAPSETPTAAAPVFASDEEALAAATEAYAAYLRANERYWDENATRDEYLSMSTGTAREQDLAAGALFEERGWRMTGATSFDSMRMQSQSVDPDGTSEIRTYLCLDVSASDVVDSAGVSVAKVGRPTRMPLEVAFVTKSESDRKLLISESKVWSGSNFC